MTRTPNHPSTDEERSLALKAKGIYSTLLITADARLLPALCEAMVGANVSWGYLPETATFDEIASRKLSTALGMKPDEFREVTNGYFSKAWGEMGKQGSGSLPLSH